MIQAETKEWYPTRRWRSRSLSLSSEASGHAKLLSFSLQQHEASLDSPAECLLVEEDLAGESHDGR
jgi:hypothetical protein